MLVGWNVSIIMRPWMDHAIVRLWALIREEELKQTRLHGVRLTTAKESNERGEGEGNKEQLENDKNRSTAVESRSRQKQQQYHTQTIAKNSTRRPNETTATILSTMPLRNSSTTTYLIGNAYPHGSQSSSYSHHYPPPRWNSSTNTDHHNEAVVQHTTILILSCNSWILPQTLYENAPSIE